MFCEKCGTPIPENSPICTNCGQVVSQQDTPAQTGPDIPVKRTESLAGGIAGALIGAVLGAAAIVLLGQLGFVASISGFILALCTLKGYELLGGYLSTKGIIICVVLMLVTPFFADWIGWTLIIMKEFPSLSFGEAFDFMTDFLADGTIELSDYLINLGMLYLFTILGAFSTVHSAFKKK